MPTLRGLKRRGYTPESIKNFLYEIGVSKSESHVDIAMLEHSLREDLKSKVLNAMVILNPLKVIITNYPEDQVELLYAENNPENPDLGIRKLPFSRIIHIEQEDFMENPSNKFFRLAPGKEVRLKNAYFIKCEEVIKDKTTGEILELHCTYDPQTKSGSGFTGRKVKSTIHWISSEHALKAEVRLYDKFLLDDKELINKSIDWKDTINPNSLTILENCLIEASLRVSKPEDKYQFIRHGYFCVDTKYTTDEKLVFNRIVSLKDSKKQTK